MTLFKGCMVSLAALAAATPGLAQDAPEPEASRLEEVVVTAQRREQQLQNVPVAVTALSSDALERLQVRDTVDLLKLVPNLVGNSNVGLGSSNSYYIRGVGNTESISTMDVPVGTYVDDIFISRQNANNFGLFDVERIEVLRGPQGTLFGRNTTGGAINVVMRKPGAEFGGRVEGAIGSFGRREARGTVDLPLSETVLTKFSGFYRQDDGYARQISTGDMLNALDSYGLRAAVRFMPSDRFTADLSADIVDETNSNLINHIDPATGDRASRLGIVRGALTPYFTGDKRYNDPGNRTRAWSATANLKWDFDAFTLTSITGVRSTEQWYYIDSQNVAPNPLPTGVSTILNYGQHDQWSQEFKLDGQAFDGRLTYVAGVYYLAEDNATDLGTASATATTFRVSGDRTMWNTLETYAVYAQGDYELTPSITATFGLRYTHEEKELRVQTNPGGAGPVLTTDLVRAAGIPTERSAEFWTPRFALAWQVNPNLMFYGSITNGAKSGGWNGRALANNLFLPFDAEKVWAKEIGMRGEFFDRTLRLNVTLFDSTTEDVQISSGYYDANNVRILTTTNPADMDNTGGEIEAIWFPTPNFSLTAAVSFQDAEFTNVNNVVVDQLTLCHAAIAANNAAGRAADCGRGFVDVNGRLATPARTPDVSGLLSANHYLNLSWADIRTTVSASYTGDYAIGNNSNPDLTDGSWTRSAVFWDAGLTIEPTAYPNLAFSIDCKNCFDEVQPVSFLSASAIYLSPPGRWSARVRYRF